MDDSARNLFICLGAAHFVGDFILQTDNDAAGKGRALILLKHAYIMGALSYLFCGIWQNWRIPAAVFLSHGIIDGVKQWSSRRDDGAARQKVYGFLLDQASHLAVAGALAFAYSSDPIFWTGLFGPLFLKALVCIAGAIVTIKVGSILIGMMVFPFLDELGKNVPRDGVTRPFQGFALGGKVIGQLERAIILLLILVDQPAGIGFLVTAKSILRVGDIKDRHHRLEAEYIIIGTLLSFGYGMLAAYATRFILASL